MSETFANLAVIGATAGTVTFLLPQIIKLIRTRDSEGVSSTWPALGFVINVGWFVYVISQSFWLATLAPLVTFISYAITLWALRRTGRDLRSSYVRGGVWALILGGVTALAGWEALGITLGISYGVQLTPSVWTAYRTSDPSGISPGTWWIGMAEASFWGYFGLFHRDIGIVTFGVVGVTAAVLMLIRYYSPRQPVTAAV